MEKRRLERCSDTRARATACDLGPVSSATKSARGGRCPYCRHPLLRPGARHNPISYPAPAYPCGHLHAPDPRLLAPLGRCSFGALGLVDTRRPGPLAAFPDCCALHRRWGTRVSGGQGECQLTVPFQPSHATQDQASRPCRPPLSAEPALPWGQVWQQCPGSWRGCPQARVGHSGLMFLQLTLPAPLGRRPH